MEESHREHDLVMNDTNTSKEVVAESTSRIGPAVSSAIACTWGGLSLGLEIAGWWCAIALAALGAYIGFTNNYCGTRRK